MNRLSNTISFSSSVNYLKWRIYSCLWSFLTSGWIQFLLYLQYHILPRFLKTWQESEQKWNIKCSVISWNLHQCCNRDCSHLYKNKRTCSKNNKSDEQSTESNNHWLDRKWCTRCTILQVESTDSNQLISYSTMETIIQMSFTQCWNFSTFLWQAEMWLHTFARLQPPITCIPRLKPFCLVALVPKLMTLMSGMSSNQPQDN